MKIHTRFMVLVLSLLFVVPVWAEPEGNHASKPVRVMMSVTPLSAPFIIAEKNGYFREHGLDVRIKEIIGGHRAAKALFNGDADIATTSEAVVMFNSFKRTDFQILCTFVRSTNDVKLLARADTPIHTVEDLAGHKVGTVKGASAHFFLDEVLALSGVDPTTLEVVHVSPEQTTQALMEGRIDAVAAWEPWNHLARQKMGEQVRLIPHDRPYIETFNAIVSRDFARRHPHVMQQLIRALIQAVDYINAHPQGAVQQVAERLKMDIPTIEALWVDLEFEVTLKQWLISTMESEARWALGRKAVEGEMPNYLEYLYLPALQQVAPDKIGVY